jgi:hypothetical protein
LKNELKKTASNNLISSVMTSSLYNLELYGKIKGAHIETKRPSDPIGKDHWQALIWAKSKVVNIAFAAHYSEATARHLASVGLEFYRGELSMTACQQFMQEYCNLTIGTLKQHLLESCVRAEDFIPGAQTPRLTHLDGEVDFAGEVKAQNISAFWVIRFGSEHIICTSKLEILDPAPLANLKPLNTSLLSVNTGGGIEFF